MVAELANFFGTPFFNIVSGISTILMMAGFLYTAYLLIKGVFPVWYRIGMGLSKRKIAVFANGEFDALKSTLVDSKIFKAKNIFRVHKNALKKADKETIFLIHWKEYKNEIDEIISIKKNSTAMIVYAPQNEGRIEQESIDKINNQRNSVIVNFRGRLLNDILISMITTSYEQK